MRRLACLALVAAAFTALWFLAPYPATPTRPHHPALPPLVFKTAQNTQFVRAVVHGRLYVFAFAYRDKVWFLTAVTAAVDLPN